MTNDRDGVVHGLYDLKNVFGDKWTLAIAEALRDGPRRRVDILSACTSYSIDEKWTAKPAVLHDSIMARTLKKMLGQGLIARTYTKTFPPEAVYALNPEIADVLTLMEPLAEWTRDHQEILEQAQSYSRRYGNAQIGSEHTVEDDRPHLNAPEREGPEREGAEVGGAGRDASARRRATVRAPRPRGPRVPTVHG